eukprot:s1967_g9.t1
MQLKGEVRLQFEANPAAMPTAVLLRWGGQSGPKWRLLESEVSRFWRMEISDEPREVGEARVIMELLFQVSEAGEPARGSGNLE